jgi:hypothetical protein
MGWTLSDLRALDVDEYDVLVDLMTKRLEKATLSVRKFEEGIGRIDKDLSKFGNQFSGVKVINDANLMEKAIRELGGVSKLTETELERAGNAAKAAADKMKALGLDVPERLRDLSKHATASTKEVGLLGQAFQKIGPTIAAAFSVGAIANFARGVGEFAGKMEDLSAETGIGTERLQELNYAASGAGLSIEDITGGITQLSKRLAGGDDSATRAVERLGLSIHALENQSPDEAFIDISKAVAGIENPMERTRTAMELFGRSGSRMLRLMTDDVEGLLDGAKRSGAVIDAELIKKADQFDDAWTQALLRVRAEMVGFVGGAVRGWEEISKAMQKAQPKAASAAGEPSLGRLFDAWMNEGQIDADLQLRRQSLSRGSGLGSVGLPAGFLPGAATARGIPNDIAAIEKKLSAVMARASEDEKAASATRRFREELEEFNTDVFRQGAAANAKGALGFLAGGSGVGGNMFPEPGRLVNRAGGLQGLLSIIAPAGPGGSNISRGGGGGFFKNLGSSLFSDAKSSFSPAKLAGSLIGSFLPGPGQLAELAVKGIGKLVGKLFGGEGKKTNDIRDQFIQAAGGIDVLAEKARQAGTSVDSLLKAKTVKEFESAVASLQGKLGQFADEAEADAARLEAAIERYGFSFEEAGAAFQKLKLDEKAKELIEDWRVLVGAGIDIGVVNEKMSEEINHYLQLALRVGQEIPNAFRPILENMLKQGTLTDEAGNAITDLESTGIHFAETMTEGFDRVVQKLDELIGKLQAAGSAIGNLPSIPSMPSESTPAFDDGTSGGIPGMPGFAKGTGGRYVNFGGGTPVMLHGRERVMTEGEGAAQAANMASVVAAVDRVSAQLGFLQQILPDQMMAAAAIGRARYA